MHVGWAGKTTGWNPFFLIAYLLGYMEWADISLDLWSIFFTGAYVCRGLAILEDSGPKIGFFNHGLRGFILWFDWFVGVDSWYLGLHR